jgi:hypothetical protein
VSLGDDFKVPFAEYLARRPPSFSETVGEGGERKFTLVGGGELGGPADFGDLQPGRLGGGAFNVPGARDGKSIDPSRAISTGKGTLSVLQATDPETGLPMDFSGQQMSRLERAQNTADLTRAAISTDPVGGPEKQARMLRALEIANREVDSAMNEIIQGQQIAIRRQQVQNQAVTADAQLNVSIARTLQAEAQKITAEGAMAQQIAKAAAENPLIARAMNALEILAKNPDANPEDRDRILAILQRDLQSAGVEFTEAGFLESLFGAPGFSISPVTPQQGVPSPAGPDPGQQEQQALMSRAQAGMSSEDFQNMMEIGLI